MKDQEGATLRQRINNSAGRAGEIAKAALGVDWYDTESQARRVAEHAAEMIEEKDQTIAKLRLALEEAREFIRSQPVRTERVGNGVRLLDDLPRVSRVLGAIDTALRAKGGEND